MIRSTHAVRAAALAGAAALVLAACSSGDSGDDATDGASADSGSPLIVGTLLPQTGSLAQLGPPEIAGVDLAVKDINAAGGVLGQDVQVEHTDSSDAEHAEVATQSVQDLISQDVSVIIGAASSSVTRNVIDDITGAKIVQISPANTATDLSGYSDFYFRTAPPDTVQGAALANLILGDGAVNPGVIVFNDDYGTSLRDVVEERRHGRRRHARLRDRRPGVRPERDELQHDRQRCARHEPRRDRDHRVHHADPADRLRARRSGVRHVEGLLRRRQPHAVR